MMRLRVQQRGFFLVLLVFSSTPLTCNGQITWNIYQTSDCK
jgi:hypothetical protein